MMSCIAASHVQVAAVYEDILDDCSDMQRTVQNLGGSGLVVMLTAPTHA